MTKFKPSDNSWHRRLKFAMSQTQRKDGGVSIDNAELAMGVGVSSTSVSSWLTGRTENIASDHLIAVCKILDIREEWLLHGTLPMRYAARSSEKEAYLTELFGALTQHGQIDRDNEVMRSLGGELLQLVLGKLALVLTEDDLRIIKGVIFAKQAGKHGQIAIKMAISALEQIGELYSQYPTNEK